MATFEKRGDYQWRAKIRREGYPNQSKTFDTKADAEAWARDTESKMDHGTFIDRSAIEKNTFGDLLDRYVKEITPDKKGRLKEESKIRGLKKTKLSQMTLARIEPGDIADYRDERLKKVANATVTKEMNLISHVFAIATSEWRMRGLTNPVTGMRRPKAPKGRDRRIHLEEEHQDRDELNRLIAETQSPSLKTLIPLAVETAMRRGEMIGIKLKDVNLDKQTIKLHDSKNGESRVVPLSTRVVKLLKELPKRADGQLFAIKPDSATTAFKRALKRARIAYEKECAEKGKIPDPEYLTNLRLHDMRHESTSRFFEKGTLETMEVAAITGHKSLQMLKRYTHLRAENLAKKLG